MQLNTEALIKTCVCLCTLSNKFPTTNCQFLHELIILSRDIEILCSGQYLNQVWIGSRFDGFVAVEHFVPPNWDPLKQVYTPEN